MEPKEKTSRKFAVLPAKSIHDIAENIYARELLPDISRLLAEDVSYRLRSLIQDARHIMKHCHRKRLKTDDLNKALASQDVPPIFGHKSSEDVQWLNLKDSSENPSGDLFVAADMNVDLVEVAQREVKVHPTGAPTIKADWLVIDGQQQETGKPCRLLSGEFVTYFEKITSAIMGDHNELMQVALNDLRTNPNIGPVLPYFAQFMLSNVIQQHDASSQFKLLHMLGSLLRNQNLYMGHIPVAELLCASATHCLLDSSGVGSGYWSVRDYAAKLLADICRNWSTKENGILAKQIAALKAVLLDSSKPLCAHYGALAAISRFGSQVVDDVILTMLPEYCDRLFRRLNDISRTEVERRDAMHVIGALTEACTVFLNWEAVKPVNRMSNGDHGAEQQELKQSRMSNSDHGAEQPKLKQSVSSKYRTVAECLGERLLVTMVTPTLPQRRFPATDNLVFLGDENSHRTGEDMLQEFLQNTPKTEMSVKMENKSSVQNTDLFVSTSDSTKKSASVSPRGSRITSGRKSSDGGARSKRHRRSFAKGRLGDAFDLQPMIRRSIAFNLHGRKADAPPVPRSVGRPPKKHKAAASSIVPRPKISVPLSEYRSICMKLPPTGKSRFRARTVQSFAMSNYFT